MWNQPRFWPRRFALSASTHRSFRWTVLWLLCQLIPGIAEPQIYQDQAGYQPESPKFFFVHQPADSFYLYAATSHELCFLGSVKLWRTNDPATGWTIYRGDFSALAASGQFYVEMPGIGRSHDFPIAATVYQPVYGQSLYDLLGRVVVHTTLVAAPNSANRCEWNGRNSLGEAVPSGIYVYQLETNHDAITRKLICFRRAD